MTASRSMLRLRGTGAPAKPLPVLPLFLLCLLLTLLGAGRHPAASVRPQATSPPASPSAGRRPPPAAGRRAPAAAARRPGTARPVATAAVAAATSETSTEVRRSSKEAGARDGLWPGDAVLELTPRPSAARGSWTLERDGFELLHLPLELGEDEGQEGAARVALEAGAEMSVLASRWRPIKNGDESLGRRQSYLRMRKHRAPLGLSAAAVLAAAERAVRERLGEDFVLNDCVAIADFDPELPRQELHRDIRRDAHSCSTHGLLAPLAPGARLHVVPRSHKPRGSLRGEYSRQEVLIIDVHPGQLLLWDGMLVHAGDGGLEGAEPGVPNRLRLHSYVEREGEDRPYDDKGDRGIVETE